MGEITSHKEALRRLKEGNARFVSMKRRHDPGVDYELRAELLKGQSPYATVLSCSDSRVPVELIFDEGLGSIFVVRVAGNIATPSLIGSIEYATLHSTSKLIVIMGHESCGAVNACMDIYENPNKIHTPGIDLIVKHIMRSVLKLNKLKPGHKHTDDEVAIENVRTVKEQLLRESPPLKKLYDSGHINIVGAFYTLAEGEVQFLDV